MSDSILSAAGKAEGGSRLQFFPISFFAIVMGLAGFAIALGKAEEVLGLPIHAAAWLTAAAGLVFLAALATYLSKAIRHRAAVAKELKHPIKLSFFPTISIGLLLLSVALLKAAPAASLALWSIGSVLQLMFTLFVLSRWIIGTHFEVVHSNPSWFIPVVGNILVPVAGVAHGFVEISWFYFSFGLLFWLVLLTLIINRMVFHHPMPEKLAPTFFILIAPPAVGFIAYSKLTGGELDVMARVLYYNGLFFLMLLGALWRSFVGIRFFLSWWAYSFPLAAITIATLVMAERTGLTFFLGLGGVLLAALAALIMLLVAKTLAAMLRGQICVED
jgi:tellurite resistance protein